VGTGEANNQRSVDYGDGIYKSLDGGTTWKNMGLKNSEHIAKIIVHPKNSNVILVAAVGPLWLLVVTEVYTNQEMEECRGNRS
jgi:hypothetical protein